MRAAMAEVDSHRPPPAISRLAARQLLAWADGDLSAVKLQMMMDDAVSDGLNHPMVVRLSRLQGGQHANQSLVALLRENTPVFDDIGEVCGGGGGGDSFLKPSAIIGRLYRHYPGEFARRLGADAGRVRSFWENLFQGRNRRELLEHPFLQGRTIDELSHVVPIVLHEDAAPVTKIMSANMISFSSAIGLGSEKDTQFLCATFIKRKKAEAEDHSALWAAMLGDFEGLMQPDNEGRGPWKFLLMFAVADEEVRCVEWGLASYNAAGECCSECRADRSSRPWTDMRRGAAWRGTERVSIQQYRDCIRQPRHPLADSKFLWRFFFYLDTMHIFDCKGVASTIAGSLMSALVRDVRLGRNQHQRLDRLNMKLRAFYARHPGLYKLPKITANSLVGSNGWAELSGPAIKAAPTRALAPFLVELASEFCGSESEEDVATRRVVGALREYYAAMGTTMFMTQASLSRLQAAIDEMGIAMQRLRHIAGSRNELSWQVRPKLHKAMHMPLFASIINPMSLNCYVRESQVGTSQKVWKGSVAGRYQRHVQRSVLAKRWLGLLLRLELEA